LSILQWKNVNIKTMKAKLLREARKTIRILNGSTEIANKTDKFCQVVRGRGSKMTTYPTTKGSLVYINFGNARNRHRAEVLEFARNFTKKPWWNVFS
jgi:hypothetical protein